MYHQLAELRSKTLVIPQLSRKSKPRQSKVLKIKTDKTDWIIDPLATTTKHISPGNRGHWIWKGSENAGRQQPEKFKSQIKQSSLAYTLWSWWKGRNNIISDDCRAIMQNRKNCPGELHTDRVLTFMAWALKVCTTVTCDPPTNFTWKTSILLSHPLRPYPEYSINQVLFQNYWMFTILNL